MVLLGEIGQDRLKMARLRHCGSSGGKVVLEIRQERQETNWKLEGGAFCTSRLQSGGKALPGGDLFGRGRSRWPRAGEEGGDSGENFNQWRPEMLRSRVAY